MILFNPYGIIFFYPIFALLVLLNHFFHNRTILQFSFRNYAKEFHLLSTARSESVNVNTPILKHLQYLLLTKTSILPDTQDLT